MVVQKDVRVLITGIGGPAAIGAFRSLKERGGVTIVGADSDPYAPGLFLVGKGYVVPKAVEEAPFINRILEISRKHKIDVILPCVDEEIPAFAKRREEIWDEGVGMLVPSPEAASKVMDKFLFYETLAQGGIPVPEHHLINTQEDVCEAIDRIGYPIVVKPCIGRGGRGVAILKDSSETEIHMRGITEPLVACEYLPGTEYDVNLVVDRKGGISPICLAETLEYRAGITMKGVTVRDEHLQRLAEDAIKSIANYLGPAGYDLKDDRNGRAKVLEINPRFTAPIFLYARAGCNLPWISVLLALGEDLPVMDKYGSYSARQLLTRAYLDIVVNLDKRKSPYI